MRCLGCRGSELEVIEFVKLYVTSVPDTEMGSSLLTKSSTPTASSGSESAPAPSIAEAGGGDNELEAAPLRCTAGCGVARLFCESEESDDVEGVVPFLFGVSPATIARGVTDWSCDSEEREDEDRVGVALFLLFEATTDSASVLAGRFLLVLDGPA